MKLWREKKRFDKTFDRFQYLIVKKQHVIDVFERKFLWDQVSSVTETWNLVCFLEMSYSSPFNSLRCFFLLLSARHLIFANKQIRSQQRVTKCKSMPLHAHFFPPTVRQIKDSCFSKHFTICGSEEKMLQHTKRHPSYYCYRTLCTSRPLSVQGRVWRK